MIMWYIYTHTRVGRPDSYLYMYAAVVLLNPGIYSNLFTRPEIRQGIFTWRSEWRISACHRWGRRGFDSGPVRPIPHVIEKGIASYITLQIDNVRVFGMVYHGPVLLYQHNITIKVHWTINWLTFTNWFGPIPRLSSLTPQLHGIHTRVGPGKLITSVTDVPIDGVITQIPTTNVFECRVRNVGEGRTEGFCNTCTQRKIKSLYSVTIRRVKSFQ
jgi:hypothetical protein